MILNGSCLNSGISSFLPYNRNPCTSKISSIPPTHRRIVSFNDRRSSRGPLLKFIMFCHLMVCLVSSNSLNGREMRISMSSPLLHEGSLFQTLPKLPNRHRGPLSPRASKDMPYNYKYSAMTEKPKWWWRTLASLPYLMPLHTTWVYAETAYHLHPFLEDLEFLTYPFLGALGRLPSWFLLAYLFVANLGVVRRKEWPHFFRFHVMMGMLLENALQIIGFVSRWMPLAVYWGKVGMHFWTFVVFAYLFTVLECIWCSLSGMYADAPFVCDAAYIIIPYVTDEEE